MAIIPDYPKIYCISKYCIKYYYIVIAIIPILLFLFWLTNKTFLRFSSRFELESYIKGKKTDRKIIFVLRSFAFLFLLISIASPFVLESKTIQGNPSLTILVDNSSSMALYDTKIAEDFHKKLNAYIPVNIRTIANGQVSAIGNGILNNIQDNDNVMVITDGSNNEGKLLGDIMLFASNINSSISTISMNSIKSDVSVSIEGPSELIKDTEGDFVVKVSVVSKDEKGVHYILQVNYDESDIVLEEQGSTSKSFLFSRKFSEGEYHKITARLLDVGSEDYFRDNNVFYKSIKVVPRPNLLYITEKNSPLARELDKIYELDIKDVIPSDISNYMAIIFNDIKSSKIIPQIDKLSDYVSDGNGLLFLGGESSFERGGYKGTILETLLPVKIGAGEEQNKSDINIVIVIDISSGTENYIAVEKALALSVLDSLSDKNNVGAVAFGYSPCTAFEIGKGIKPLREVKEQLKKSIASLKFDGQSCFNIGIEGGFNLLSKAGGSKNIIFISDGKTTYQKLREDTLNVVRNVNAKGVKVFVVGVGTETDSLEIDNNLFLGNIAALGEGIYYKADASNKLKIQFGDKDETKGEEYYNTLVPIDTTHFITLGMDEMHATISGYNYGVPKPASRILVSTNKNIPILVVWRFGLGRVVSMATDDGLKWAGDLLNKQNSKLLTKSINWAIGDLSKKKTFDVTIKDGVVGKSVYINVISKELPKSTINFSKIDTNTYSSSFIPQTADVGYKDILGSTFAVNYNDEYFNLGVNQEFITLINKTNGKVFDPEDTKSIIEFVKSRSKRIKIQSIDYRWPFAILALIFFLAEIAIRRYRENRLHPKKGLTA